ACVLLLGLGAALFATWHRQQVADAQATFRHFRHEGGEAAWWLNVRAPEEERLREGERAGERALARYRVREDPGWQRSAAVRRLGPRQREELAEAVADLLWSLARAACLRADGLGGAERSEKLASALELNRLALECGGRTQALLSQRADVLEKLGRSEK